MKHTGSILIVDDNPDILIAARLLLKQHYQSVKTTDNPFDIADIINEQRKVDQPIDVILLDMNFTQDSISGKEGFYWLKKIIEQDANIVVLLMTAYGDIQLAVDAIKAGASDFIAKPWQNEQLLGAVAAAFSHAKDKQQVGQLTLQKDGLNQVLNNQPFEFLGQSAAMQQVFTTIEKAAQTDANILITGESGTGKELTAHAIHQASMRHNQTFMSLDMGAVAQNLFESELFGHKKGAFTDAKSDRIGKFELAQDGSLFLDELGNLPLEHQAKLLAALQNRQITPVGGSKAIDIDIRLICATNDNLEQAVIDGRFRQDLLYRINTVEIRLPALRERSDDIPLLANYYLKHFAQKYKRDLTISDDDMNALCQYAWPGNVRELAHAIERAVILTEGDTLDISSVVGNTTALSTGNSGQALKSETEYDTFDLDILEQRTVRAALKHHQGNVSHAAKALGLTRGAMYRRLEKYRL
ncbi:MULTISPECIES: sigma-54-dependent transcriptional regulator [unclassified Pseudoalteromonas]|uniref:sigma-54-dependent transcriptional regulator n=1 Tax=unclassified Pseudoalteromonas TaxID=194690 RepID=UPI0016020F9D|nr:MULTISPECIES: sigma-54 dependent transcriptional regulator [unclassified Pseudoalteromonas]MBB1335175.1 sigma-54-dependent Fis family transcriptional regulator [Pseudoalteromonas sp. SR41-6]MBB1342552.1 sigma-54-dependent Fis family transcriptional regulator [Pseudoalteromonas sp. SR45-6]MBB1435375.1 sigma-54-dependent Fis family transcriptional regulator [Pseudoalteromonas sp. SG43-6]MBB1460635.1 sigma-54-dependent Fis family transcriptional regulator [Pseudoalteromonas sp. SG41-8]MBB14817